MVKKTLAVALAISFASLLAMVPSAYAKRGADDVVPEPQQIEQEKVAKRGADDVVPEPQQIEQEKVG